MSLCCMYNVLKYSCSIVCINWSIKQIMCKLSISYLILLFFKEPVEYILGWSYETSVSDSHIDRVNRVNNTCYVVPLLSSLQSLLNNTSIIEQVILILSMDILSCSCHKSE